jgi:acyl dehydratase
MAHYEVKVDKRELILYALGIGFQKDPLNKEHYNFSYENADDFQAFPTIAVVLGHRGGAGLMEIPGIPEFNPMSLLHGEERVEIFSPIEVDTTVVCTEVVHELQDKGKATVMVVRTEIKDKDSGELKARIFMNAFVRGVGGFKVKGTFRNPIPETPKGAPTASREEKTTADQAFLYRLNGDYNPLHVDPQMSAMGGFKVPILHGLCTYGVTARAVYEQLFKGEAPRLKEICGRFTSHVFPGETLVVDMWVEGDRVVFNTKTKERGLVVLKGYLVLAPQAKL